MEFRGTMSESTRIHRQPNIVTLLPQGGKKLPPPRMNGAYRGVLFDNIDALLAASDRPDAIVLQPADVAQQRAWITALRRDARIALQPVFSPVLAESAVAALLDGVPPDSPEQLRREIELITMRTAALPAREYPDDDARLLAYLYTRPERLIEPIADWRQARLYAYPLLEVVDRTGDRSADWADSLKRRGLIERVRLVDRVRQCGSCSSSHLNYVDECPACAHLDIGETIFLHCYTCGQVAPQNAFLTTDGLSCNKCLVRLRHIGVDYDRALETYCCHGCSARFSEPQVVARCMDCGRKQNTTDLAERQIESYRLSEKGERMARTGDVGDLLSLIDNSNCAHPALFEHTLDWLLNLRLRHPELLFGVICIQLANLRELIDAGSRSRAVQLVDGFAERLRQLVRSTDLLMRSDERHCWLLLPQTEANGVRTLAERITALPALSGKPGEPLLKIALQLVVSGELGREARTAQMLMTEMLGGIG